MPTNEKKPAKKPKPGPAKPGMPKEAAAAYLKAEAEIMAVDPKDLERINVDIPRAISVAIGALPHLNALRPQIVEELPKFDIRLVDQLPTYALALWYAHILTLPVTTEKELARLLEEATPLREDMLVAAEALAHKGYLDPVSVKAIREGQGNIDKANDLVALASVFSREWEAIKNKTTVEWANVERASALGPAVLVALGARDQPGVPTPSASVSGLRQSQAYTLFVRAYDECRRVVSFLRWHEDDVDLITPSLFATRGGRKAPSEVGASEEAPAVSGDAKGSAPDAPSGT